MTSQPVFKKLGKYDILGEIGRGGMGVVYKGRDPELERFVALKVIHPPLIERDKEYLKRFLNEAKMAARITDPNLLTVFDWSSNDGHPFIVMEFIAGDTFAQVISKASGPLPVERALRMTREAAQGLDSIHRAGLVHRDIKPWNIMRGNDGRVRIMDFGLARPLSDATPEFAGTPQYMAPELLDSHDYNAKTDIYALGITLFELLAGRNPFLTPENKPDYSIISHEGAPPISSYRTDCPIVVEKLVRQMVAPAPYDRYPDIHSVIDGIDECLRELDRPPPSTIIRRSPPFAVLRRSLPFRKIRVVAKIILFAAVLGFVIWPHGLSDLRYLQTVSYERTPQVILIDMESWPPKTSEVAELIRMLKERGATVIGLDFVLDQRSQLTDPESLAEPIRKAGNVVVAKSLRDGNGLLPDIVSAAARSGFANVVADWDGRIRRARTLAAGPNGAPADSFALCIAKEFEKRIPAQSKPADPSTPVEIVIDYGALEHNILIPKSRFEKVAAMWNDTFCRDKAFIIGTTQSSDFHNTPLIGKQGTISGLALQGVTLDNLLNHRWFRSASFCLSLLLFLPFGGLGVGAGVYFGTRRIPYLLCAIGALFFLVAFVVFAVWGIVVPVAWPIVGVAALGSVAAWRAMK